ncbi:hypothetical protein HanHA89_Chr17g0711611 [Helianthus annuus]|nr:hypothetical protein HanHA89_Chr17g0711611 [Helianthus annuus]
MFSAPVVSCSLSTFISGTSSSDSSINIVCFFFFCIFFGFDEEPSPSATGVANLRLRPDSFTYHSFLVGLKL